ncbi:MAG: hypothetical protein D3903_03055 [Candidatus Electrothrix sp. GM3_4]|nr:hypothetical protein [Candidatus Electrothrix sp. GM3_4]
MPNSKKSIGIKIHDMHHGLSKSTGAIIETELDLLKNLGAAIQIATTIKDHEIIRDLTPFYAAAGELRIQKPIAKEALHYLEKLGFVRLKWDTGKDNITRIDVVVPELSKIYTDFGDYFISENKSVIAGNFVSLIDKLSLFPHKEKDITSLLGLDPKDYDCIKDIGSATSLLDTYVSPADSESVIYSPIYWDDNPGKIFELMEKYDSSTLSNSLKIIKNHQGISGENINDNALNDAILPGCFPTLCVSSTSGLKKFVFTPQLGVGKEEKVLLHKARVLLSSVRYGESFAGITKIHSPGKLINALAGRGFLKAHSESLKQYESARNHGLVKLIPAVGNRYEVHFIDNDENKKAVNMAIEMLQVGEATKFDDSHEVARKILLPDSIQHPIQTRTHILKTVSVNRSAATIEKINDTIRGVNI